MSSREVPPNGRRLTNFEATWQLATREEMQATYSNFAQHTLNIPTFDIKALSGVQGFLDDIRVLRDSELANLIKQTQDISRLGAGLTAVNEFMAERNASLKAIMDAQLATTALGISAQTLASFNNAQRTAMLASLSRMVNSSRLSFESQAAGDEELSGTVAKYETSIELPEEQSVVTLDEQDSGLLPIVAANQNIVRLMLAIYNDPETRFLLNKDGREFEELIGETLARLGASDVYITSRSGDGGVDVYATIHDNFGPWQMAIQAKRYAKGSKVGLETAQAIQGVASNNNLGRASVWTTSGFQDCVYNYAANTKGLLTLVNGDQVAAFVKQALIKSQVVPPE